MNIFALDYDPQVAANYMINVHCGALGYSGKMIVESSQMLANCYKLETLTQAPKTQKGKSRKYSYYSHPCSIWTRKTYGNFEWLLFHANYLVEEKLYRDGPIHFCNSFIKWCFVNYPDNLESNSQSLTPFALAMPDIYKQSCPIQSYRNYYINDKQIDKNGKWMMTYTKRETPYWMPRELRSKIAQNAPV